MPTNTIITTYTNLDVVGQDIPFLGKKTITLRPDGEDSLWRAELEATIKKIFEAGSDLTADVSISAYDEMTTEITLTIQPSEGDSIDVTGTVIESAK